MAAVISPYSIAVAPSCSAAKGAKQISGILKHGAAHNKF